MMTRLLIALLLTLGLSTPAWAATTYYVDRGLPGSDSNSGLTEALPFLTVAKCATMLTAPGDMCFVKNGTYTETTTVRLQKSGTAAAHIALKAYPGHTPIIRWASQTGVNNNILVLATGSEVGSPIVIRYIDIEGLEITNSYRGITAVASEFITIRNNHIHDNYASVQTNHAYAWTVDRNYLHDSGHVTAVSGSGGTVHGNGLYITGTGHVITNNTFSHLLEYGVQASGQVYSAAQATATRQSGFQGYIANNIFAYNGQDILPATSGGSGGIVFTENCYGRRCGGAADSIVENNLFFENQGGSGHPNGVYYASGGGSGGEILRNNYSFSTAPRGLLFTLTSAGGAAPIQSNNHCLSGCPSVATNPLFVNGPATDPASPDFRLTSSSPAALSSGGFGGGRIGVYGLFAFSSATINENFMDVTVNPGVVPVGPATGQTGWTVNNGRTVTSAVRLTGTDSVVRLTISGAACIGGQTWTVTYSGTGNVVSGSGQAMSAFTAQPVTNACGVAPPAAPGTPSIRYSFDENTGTNAADAEPVTGGDQPGTLVNGPTWEAPGKDGASAVHFVNGGTDRVDVPYGSGVNPSTQSLTVCLWVKVDASLISSTRIYFGTPNGTNQRFYLNTYGTTWGQGVQTSSGFVSNPEFPVTAEWTRICQRFDSVADTTTLFKNGVKGTSAQSVKTYTSYTLSANINIGHISGSGTDLFGGTIDEPVIYTSALTDQEIADDFDAAEPPAPPAAGTYAQIAHQFHNGVPVNGVAQNLGALSGAIDVHAGVGFALTVQVDCTVADCAPTGERLYYSRNSGPFLPVPDTIGPDQISFYGDGGTTLTGEVVCCLSGALTPANGTTQRTMAAVPVYDLPLNGSIIQRYVLKLGPDAVLTDTYDLKSYHQTGEAFAAYTPAGGARVTVGAALSAPTGLKLAGVASNTSTTLIWPPNTDTFLVGYYILCGTATGVYAATPCGTVTFDSAASAHSPVTRWITRTLVGATYYYAIKAFDNGDNESPVSNEVSIVMTGMTPR